MIKTGVGIELAGKDFRVAVVRAAFGKLSLVKTVDIPGFSDLSMDDQTAAVHKLIADHKLPMSRVFLTLPRERGLVRQIELPVEVGDKLKSAIALQLETLCPWPL